MFYSVNFLNVNEAYKLLFCSHRRLKEKNHLRIKI